MNASTAGTRLRALLLDLDGVLYDGERPIAGADTAIQWLQTHQVPYLYISNTTSRPRSALAEKLVSRGIPATAESILTPAAAVAHWLATEIAGGAAGGTQDSRGFRPLRPPTASGSKPPEAPPPDAPRGVALFVPQVTHVEFAGLPVLPPDAETGAGYVVVGDLGDAWTFAQLNRAFRLLMANPAAVLIALGMSRYWKAEDGLRLDAAPFVVALQHATGRVPKVFGKPESSFFLSALDRLGMPPAAVAVVGDDILTDVGAAQKAGLRGMLVRTGKYQPADLEHGVVPYAVIDSVADLPAWWTRHVKP